MAYEIVGLGAIALLVFIFRFLNSTDAPRIKNLPEIPGLPVFGSLLQFGQEHARVARALADKHGPVFQVRLGSKVCWPWLVGYQPHILTSMIARSICKFMGERQAHLDSQPVRPNFPSYLAYFSYRRKFISRLHYWHITMG